MQYLVITDVLFVGVIFRGLANLYDGGHLVAEDVEELDVLGNAGHLGGTSWTTHAVGSLAEGGETVDQGYDDVLDVDSDLELRAGFKKRVQRLQVEFVGENLKKITRVEY